MNQKQLEMVRRRVHKHTVLVMFECANQGHGADNDRAIDSAEKLIDMIDALVDGASEDMRKENAEALK